MSLEIVLATIVGFIAGFVDAIAGGGGVITFPTLLYLNLPVSVVVGTNKLINICGTSVAAATFLRHGKINRELVRVGLPLTFLGALLGAILILRIPNEFLKPFVGVLLLGLALYFFVRPKLGGVSGYTGATTKALVVVAAAAFSIGFYDGFFGPGTGMFLMFVFVRFIKLDFVHAAGNTKILNLASNIVALAYFMWQGNIDYRLGIPMAIANLAGGYYGASSAVKVGPSLVRWIFMLMATVLAIKMWLDYF